MSILDLSTPPAQAETPADLSRKQEAVKPAGSFGDMALALSGGGFRAAAFSLGAISYLNRAWLSSADDPLLKHISFTTSTSGGSLTNAVYSTAIFKPGFVFDEFYEGMKTFMNGEDLLTRVFDILTNAKKWNEKGTETINGKIQKVEKSHNLINAFAKAYDEMLFKNSDTGKSETLDIFFNRHANPHLKTVCFNATELNNGIAFRFQTNGYPDSIFTVGNYYLHFNNADVARKLKISDIAATSSCFPSGFEPMIYPHDYIHPGLQNVDDMLKAIDYKNNNPLKLNTVVNKPFCMMDGGVVDNQGLESMMMEDNFRAKHPDKKPFDLMMVCDVGSYFMDRFEPIAATSGTVQNITLKTIRRVLSVGLLGLAISIYLLFCCPQARTIGLLLLIPMAMISAVYLFTKYLTAKKMEGLNSTHFGRTIARYLGYFGSLKFGLLQQMMIARFKSILMLNLNIFLAQERRQSYSSFYGMPVYKNRALSCFIYEFSCQHDQVRKNNLETKDAEWWKPAEAQLTPSKQLQDMATKATSMATTLWFDAGPQTMRDAVIACGQFTMCYNLLKHIYRLELLDAYWKTDSELQQLKARLLADWALFNANPGFMV
ncbi:patatin-like phospholipase family protein [Mucilaginibacter sp. HMF5004]|uniref:patatin-like phospholipase family protein n=1 Tax=Mucilaginibacter rivuli TaxID=2857527 RepID=UPI001C5CD178|nr:patatin-like phospholipase family protein [Mucilaginibacter rivuli]MBW4888756.1 patatin-like phospholipase family protein [Mucilaginibacter rivuli]